MFLVHLNLDCSMNKRDEEFGQFIGSVAFEDDGGWSKQVWNAAWHACLMYIIERSNKDKPVEQQTDA